MREERSIRKVADTDETEAIKANHEPTLQRIYHRNYKNAEILILTNSGSAEQAKDIYQEAFIALWRNLQSGQFTATSPSSLDAYLLTIVRNKWMDWLRSAQYKRTMPLNDEASTGVVADTGEVNDERTIEAVKKQFDLLGANCKEVLQRFYYRKESLRTIAEAMQWTEATARNNKYRCLEKLRQLVINTNPST